jgi:pyruvate dehydrogenase E2 component (dihydrolipoamide acetyltransferase)
MAKLVKVPVLGQSVEEVRLLQWLKKEGDTVAKGENLAEIETDKVNTFFESTEDGVVRRLLIPEGEFVKVEAPALIVGTADEPIDDLLGAAGGGVVDSPALTPPAPLPQTSGPRAGGGGGSDAVASGAVAASPRARRAADEAGIEIAALAGRGTGPRGRVQEKDVFAYVAEQGAAALTGAGLLPDAARVPKASPLARAVAGDSGVDLSAVTGSGVGGRITAGDVRASSLPSPTGSQAGSLGEGQGVRTAESSRTVTLTGLRKRVADNIAKSVRNAPHVTLNTSADMTEAMRLRAQLLPVIEKATGGVRVSPTDIVVKAAAAALREFPYVNAHIDGDTLTLFDDVHVGLAVSLGEEGLIVPVIKDAHRIGLSEIARARQELATRARAGKLTGDDITGGTFTISNLGNYGIESFNPIINPPQVAILGVGSIQDTVVARDGAPAVRPMMGLSLSFDHRAMDGAPAAAFLARLREILETPTLLLV